jgi:hypothetical protein
MNDIFVIRGTLTVFGNLGEDIDTIGSFFGGEDTDIEVVVWGGYVYFSQLSNYNISIIYITFIN